MPVTPELGRQRLKDCHRAEAIMVYIVSSRSARPAGDPHLKNKKTKYDSNKNTSF